MLRPLSGSIGHVAFDLARPLGRPLLLLGLLRIASLRFRLGMVAK